MSQQPDNELDIMIGHYHRELAAAADDDITPNGNFKQHLLAWRDKATKEVAKAYGNCTKCYGKGYATWRHGETYRGVTHNMRDDIKFCTCERGKQLKVFIEQLKWRV